jgi:hypothetical protein
MTDRVVYDHVGDVTKMVGIGSGDQREITDVPRVRIQIVQRPAAQLSNTLLDNSWPMA